MPDLHGWTMTVWPCPCGRAHAPWWRTTPPPSCPLWRVSPTEQKMREIYGPRLTLV
jgi:hypothetical protein